MSFVIRSVGTLALSVGFLIGCGGGSDTNFAQPGTGGKKSTGGGDHDASSGGGTGGRGGTGTGGRATGGSSGASGGDGGDASSAGGSDASAGGSDAGTSGGAGGRAAGGAGGGAGGAGPKKPNGQACTAGTNCTSGNCVGGVCCAVACNTPGPCQQLTGTQCLTTPSGTSCEYGLLPDKSACDDGDPCTVTQCNGGACEVTSPKDCSDGNNCTDDACNSSGTCTHTATNCDDKNPCTTDTCGASGCVHVDTTTTPPNACNDNNPCTTDSCSGGLCVHKAKDCGTLDDDCNKGVCSTAAGTLGQCVAQPANANAACTMGLDACDSAGSCNAAGACVGDNDACGALASACATCGASCHTCTCQANAVVSGGVCVPQTNECALVPSPCVTNATCSDPSSAAGNVVCTCPKGFTGNGKVAPGTGCTDVNECSGTNPCGAGTCNNTPGSYTCTCPAGLKMVTTTTGQKCVCDLGGTYGLIVDSNVTWTSPNPAIESSPVTGVPIRSWTLRYNTVAANGTMTSQTIPCGGSSPTFCDTAFGFAHAQFQPSSTWGKKKVNDGFAPFNMSLVGVVPGVASGTYSEPTTYSLQGITLDDPAGEWPPCAACVGVDVGSMCTCAGTQHTVTNKATWVDADGDNHLGFTTDTVPRGGQLIGSPYIIDGFPADPQWDYTEPSECPRNTGGAKYNYSEFPGIVGILPFRAYRWYLAGRVISSYVGTSVALQSNQCVISGNVTGPDNGKPHGDGRVQGCEICGGTNTCTAAGPCSPPQASSYDDLSQNQDFISTTFTLKNVTSSINLAPVMSMADGPAKETALNQACQQLRVQNCPVGKSCN